MNVNSANVYLKALTAHQLPQAIGAASLWRLASAFSQMARDLRRLDAPAAQQEAFQSTIAEAAEGSGHLTAAERAAVKSSLFTAFDGLPRRHSATPVRTDFLRQVRFPEATGSYGSAHASTREVSA